MYQPILSMQHWLELKQETKSKLRELFGIPRSGYVEVFDGRVLCDGTMMEDLMYLSVEKMQKHLNSKEGDFYKLFNEVINKIETPIINILSMKISNIENPKPQVAISTSGVQILSEVAPIKKRGRPFKK